MTFTVEGRLIELEEARAFVRDKIIPLFDEMKLSDVQDVFRHQELIL